MVSVLLRSGARKMGKAMSRTIGLDVETSKIPFFHPWQQQAFLVAVGIVDETGYKKTWLFNHIEADPSISDLNNVLEIQAEIDRSYRIAGHNLKFDLNWLRHIGIKFDHKRLYCTKIAEYMISGMKRQAYSLKALSLKYGITPKIDKVATFWEAGYETSEIPLNVLLPYLEQDCINTLVIYQKQVPQLQDKGLEQVCALHCRLQCILSEIECTGILADKDLGYKLIGEIQHNLDTIDLGLHRLLGVALPDPCDDINLNSGDELSAALFGGILKRPGFEDYITTRNVKYKEPYIFKYADGRTAEKTKTRVLKELVYKTRKSIQEIEIDGAGFKPAKGTQTKKEGYYQTSKGIIEQLGGRTKNQKEIKKLLVSRSAVAKSLESFIGKDSTAGLINKIQSDGRIHPKYNQTVAVTGRLSSSDPNGQNLPREGTSPIKRIFIPRFDRLMAADLSQLEWRVAALLSQDPVMIQEVLDDGDIHGENAVNFFGDISFRKVAKFFTFRMIYGGSAYGFYMDYKMPDFALKRWERIVEDFYKKYTGLYQWQLNNIRTVNRSGILTIPSGRYFAFKEYNGDYNPRHVKNYPVQGFAFDIVALAMVIIEMKMKAAQMQSMEVAQVHDEIVFDIVRGEFKSLARLCIETFEELPAYMEQFWGYKVNVPFTGEVSLGKNYEQMKTVNRDYYF